jgi:hypothetical protein
MNAHPVIIKLNHCHHLASCVMLVNISPTKVLHYVIRVKLVDLQLGAHHRVQNVTLAAILLV